MPSPCTPQPRGSWAAGCPCLRQTPPSAAALLLPGRERAPGLRLRFPSCQQRPPTNYALWMWKIDYLLMSSVYSKLVISVFVKLNDASFHREFPLFYFAIFLHFFPVFFTLFSSPIFPFLLFALFSFFEYIL